MSRRLTLREKRALRRLIRRELARRGSGTAEALAGLASAIAATPPHRSGAEDER